MLYLLSLPQRLDRRGEGWGEGALDGRCKDAPQPTLSPREREAEDSKGQGHFVSFASPLCAPLIASPSSLVNGTNGTILPKMSLRATVMVPSAA